MDNWTYAGGQAPQVEATFKLNPEDFLVREVLGFTLQDEPKGQHHWLWIEKCGANTEFVARQIAKFVDVPVKEVGYSGIKDRHAKTWQWFSVQLPATREVNWNELQHDEFTILEQRRVEKKLRRGSHQANDFEIRLRRVTDKNALVDNLEWVKANGAPNYYGPQRFGHDGRNIEKALAMFAGKRIKDRNLRSILLSSARSYLFNEVVSARIQAKLWNQPLPGDVMVLTGSHSYFIADTLDSEIETRLAENDIGLSAPLWGRGQNLSKEQANAFEEKVLTNFNELKDGLERAGLKQERRALVCHPEALNWSFEEDDCIIKMRLPAGVFATTVLREVISLQEGSEYQDQN